MQWNNISQNVDKTHVCRYVFVVKRTLNYGLIFHNCTRLCRLSWISIVILITYALLSKCPVIFHAGNDHKNTIKIKTHTFTIMSYISIFLKLFEMDLKSVFYDLFPLNTTAIKTSSFFGIWTNFNNSHNFILVTKSLIKLTWLINVIVMNTLS